MVQGRRVQLQSNIGTFEDYRIFASRKVAEKIEDTDRPSTQQSLKGWIIEEAKLATYHPMDWHDNLATGAKAFFH